MTNRFPDLINTRLQPGAEPQPSARRFSGFPAASKPLKRFGPCSYRNTGLKPGVNESASGKLLLFIFLLTLCFSSAALAAQAEDAEYEAVAEEYIKTYLAAHPLQGTALGLHEYDGKISDYSRLALDAELNRLQRFDDRLKKFDPSKLSARQSIDLRILQAAVKKDLFEMQDMSIFERNPMVYARAADVNVYIKRNFAPLEDRVRSLVAIESQIPNILIAARTNLNEQLPKPFVELAIQIAKGSADFLKKDLVVAVGGLKDEQLRAAFQEANRKAANALNDYAAWLEREKLPKASLDFALGEEKFGRFLAQTELVDLPPQKVLEIGMAQLKAEQQAFAEAAKKNRPEQVANRSVQANPKRTSNARQTHFRCRQRPGQNSQVRCEPSFGQHPLGGSRKGQGDAAISACHVLCIDGYSGSIREAGYRGLLLRYADRERLAGETKTRMAHRLQLLHLRRRFDS